MRLASIDIGSNAIRLLIKNVFAFDGIVQYQKESLIRVPLRLGREAFNDGRISAEKHDKIMKTMGGFKSLMEVYGIENYRAVATSALRNAENGQQIVGQVLNETGISIQVIDGHEEAKILYSMDISHQIDPEKACIYMDVGGGSTDISLFANDAFQRSESFPIGTIRLLNDLVTQEDWQGLKSWLQTVKKEHGEMYAIGSGGNINKLIKMYGKTKKKKKRIGYKDIMEAYEALKQHTYEERIRLMQLKPDRADVILPACEIFRNAMAWAGIKRIYVPTIGLADGLIKQLYEEQYAREEVIETRYFT